jgi:hypothetical protein
LVPDVPWFAAWVTESHVLPVTILAELGIVGFFIVAWLFWRMLWQGIKGIEWMKHDPYYRNICIGLTAVFITFSIDFLFYSDMFNNLFWLTIGLMSVMYILGRSKHIHQNEFS